MFCGRHPFHNYTKRKQYIQNEDSWSSGKRRRKQDSEQVLEEDDDDPQQEPNIIDPSSNGSSREEYEVGLQFKVVIKILFLGAVAARTGNWKMAFLEM